ncbi:MAG: alpha/beta hydrolase [Acidimicrobiia bacterium]
MKNRLASRVALGLGSVAVAAGALATVRLSRFYHDLSFETAEDERIVAETDDGWQLSLFRYAAKGRARPFPVVAGHGFAGSHLIWDLTAQTSLARFLADAGFDVYTVDIRGRGDSRPVGGSVADAQWSFDDIVHHDLPTAVAEACTRSGSEQAFWIGLEMSGQALYAAAISGTTDGLRGGITCGAPAVTPSSARVPGVSAPPRSRRNGRIPFRAGSRAAGPLLALTRSRQLESSFRPGNSDPVAVGRYLYNGVPDESEVLADQFTDWVDHGTMRSLDGATVWSERLDEVTLPVLVMAGAHDLQRPAEAVRATFDRLGSSDRTYVEAGTDGGFSVDYGHDDLVAGRRSRAEIFPRISAWLDAHS